MIGEGIGEEGLGKQVRDKIPLYGTWKLSEDRERKFPLFLAGGPLIICSNISSLGCPHIIRGYIEIK